MLVGRFKTYRKKESFGSLFFGLIFLPGFSSLLDPKRKGSQSDHSVTFALSVFSPGTHPASWSGGSWIAKVQKFAERPLRYFCTKVRIFWFADARHSVKLPRTRNPSASVDRIKVQRSWDAQNLQTEPPSNKYRSEVEGCRTKKKET